MMFCYPMWIGIYLNFDGNDEQVYRKYWDMYENHFVENIDATIS